MNLNDRQVFHSLSSNKYDELRNQSNKVEEIPQNDQMIKRSKLIQNSVSNESKQVSIIQDLREIDEYQNIINNQQSLIAEQKVQISKLKQTIHEKEMQMLEIISTMNVNIETQHQILTKDHFKEILAQKQIIQELQKQKEIEKNIEIEESKRQVQIHHENVIQRYERQLESSFEKINEIQLQLQALKEELALERIFKQELIEIGENVQEGYDGNINCEDNRQQINSRKFYGLGLSWLTGITDDLIKGRNELVKYFFEDISYFMRELHQQIQNTQTSQKYLFLQRIYKNTYKRLQQQIDYLNRETEWAFSQMEYAINPLKQMMIFYEPLKIHMHEIQILLLDILSQILKQKIND